jgi:hypothetical protein
MRNPMERVVVMVTDGTQSWRWGFSKASSTLSRRGATLLMEREREDNGLRYMCIIRIKEWKPNHGHESRS